MAEGCLVREIDPPPDLAPFVAKLISVRIRSNYVRLCVPAGCFIVGVAVHEESGRRHSYVFTPQTTWDHCPTNEGWCFIEARLRWGVGQAFLNGALSVTNGHCFRADDFLGKAWTDQAMRIADAKSAGRRMGLFVDALRRIDPEKHVLRPEIRRTVRLLEHGEPPFRVQDLADAAALSVSQIRRVMVAETGLAPGTFIRLSRLWSAMKLCLERPELAWSQISAKTGYYDQAHLVDEFRRFTGTPPRQWYANLFGVGELSDSTPIPRRHSIEPPHVAVLCPLVPLTL